MESSRRPLSAYNLFCRFKHQKIFTVEASSDGNLETTKRLVMSIPGLEEYPVLEAAMSSRNSSDALDATADADVKQYCKLEIRNCLSKKTTLKYSQGNSFIDINKLMSAVEKLWMTFINRYLKSYQKKRTGSVQQMTLFFLLHLLQRR